jgi:PadR family transcriptional regulator, regulatory protein PadR
MSAPPRMTSQVRAILHVLMREPVAGACGADIAREAGVPLGPMHTILERLEQAAWVGGEWHRAPVRGCVPGRQRIYRLTPLGQEQAASALAVTTRRLRTASPVLSR